MKPRILVLRPEPGAEASCERARAAGFEVVKTPLFVATALAWAAPDPDRFDALMMTSAHAARLGGEGLYPFTSMRLYAVGAATEAAARERGFRDIRVGTADAETLLEQAMQDGVRRLLHLAGREHRLPAADGLSIEPRLVYAVDAVDSLPTATITALSSGTAALLHSPRAAGLFARLVDVAGLSRSDIAIAGFSQAVIAAAGEGWRAAVAAPVPTDDALLAVAAGLCEAAPQEVGKG